MVQNFESAYPTISQWVQEYGWIELGQDDMSQSFARTLGAAMQDLETGLVAWMQEQGL